MSRYAKNISASYQRGLEAERARLLAIINELDADVLCYMAEAVNEGRFTAARRHLVEATAPAVSHGALVPLKPTHWMPGMPIHSPTKSVKCDGNHSGPRCADPDCWNDDDEAGFPSATLRGEVLALGERASQWFADGTRTDVPLTLGLALTCIDGALLALAELSPKVDSDACPACGRCWLTR